MWFRNAFWPFANRLPGYLKELPQLPSPDTAYDSLSDAAYSLKDGSVVWQGPQVQIKFARTHGAPASNSRIVFENGHLLTVYFY